MRENPDGPTYESFIEHVEHYLDGVDRLREYRNHLVHNSQYDRNNETSLAIARLSSRGRFGFQGDEIERTELTKVSGQIEPFILYGDSLEKALNTNDLAEPTTWPEKPPLPDKIKTTPPELLGDTRLPEPSRV